MKKTLLCLLFLLPSLFYAQINSIIHCAGDNVFDLTSRYDQLIKDLTPDQNITIKYYTKNTYASNDEYAIADPKNFIFNESQLQIYANVYTNGEIKYRSSFLIILNSALNIAYANVTNPVCGNIRLNVGATGGRLFYKYSLDGINYQSESFFDNVNPGTYTLYVKDDYGCTTTLEKTINPVAPVMATYLKTDVYCFGAFDGRIEVNASGGQLPYSYSVNGTGYQASNIFSNLQAGHYDVTVKDAAGCLYMFPVDIVNPEILTSLATYTRIPGNNNVQITATATGGMLPYSYQLRDTYGYFIVPYQSSNIFNIVGSGNYIVEVKDAKGCVKVTPITVSPPLSPLSISAIATDASCNNPDATIEAVAGGGSGSYLYAINNGTYNVSNVFSNLSPGNYTINTQDSSGSIASIQVVINPFIPLTATVINTKINGCSENNVSTIDITASGGKTPYLYSINSLSEYQESNTFSNVGSGAYTINVKDNNDCIFTYNLAIEPSALTSTVTINEAKVCGEKDAATIKAIGGQQPYTYSFTGDIYSDRDTSELDPGYHTVYVKDANGCVAVQTFLIFPSTFPVSTILTYSNTTTPNSNDGSITMSATGGTLPYQYSLIDSNNVEIISDQLSNTFNNLSPGNYSILVQDAKGCASQITQATIYAPTSTLTAIGTVIQTCNNPAGLLTITASGGTGIYTYSIDNGATYSHMETFTVLEPRNYMVKVRDSENTEYAFNIIIEPLNPLVLTASIVSMPTCYHGGIIHLQSIGGKTPHSYSINGSSFEYINILENLSPGAYTITAKDDNGCSETVVLTLEPPVAITAAVTTQDQTVTVIAAGGVGNYQYSLDGIHFQTNNIFTIPNYGMYQISVKDENGCIVVVMFELNPPSPLIEGKDEIIIEFKSGQTLGDLIIEGQNIKWYSTPGTSLTGKTSKTAETSLPLSTVLVNGVTYYASQTINGIESKERLAVTAKINGSLATPDFEFSDFRFYPNPVKHLLSVRNKSTIDTIEIFSISGQSFIFKKVNNTYSEIDLSSLSTGMYILNVKSEGKEKAIKFIKE